MIYINEKPYCTIEEFVQEYKDTLSKIQSSIVQQESILLKADKIVNGSRNVDYGAEESFDKISKMASIMTSKELSPSDCIKVLMAVKMVRESFKHKEDNLIDLCGYAELLNQINNK